MLLPDMRLSQNDERDPRDSTRIMGVLVRVYMGLILRSLHMSQARFLCQVFVDRSLPASVTQSSLRVMCPSLVPRLETSWKPETLGLAHLQSPPQNNRV